MVLHEKYWEDEAQSKSAVVVYTTKSQIEDFNKYGTSISGYNKPLMGHTEKMLFHITWVEEVYQLLKEDDSIFQINTREGKCIKL